MQMLALENNNRKTGAPECILCVVHENLAAFPSVPDSTPLREPKRKGKNKTIAYPAQNGDQTFYNAVLRSMPFFVTTDT